MFLIDLQGYALLLLAVCIVPIAILIITAIIVRVNRSIKKSKELEESINTQEKDTDQRQIFYDAYGSEDNVTSLDKERNKIIVKVKDMDKVNGEKLKELGATGVLLVGNEVRCSFGDRASYIFELMN